MMSNISAYEEYLLLGKMTDSLNEKEKLECEALLIENPAAVRAFEVLSRQLPADDMKDAFRFLNAPGYWRDLGSELQQEVQEDEKEKETHIGKEKEKRKGKNAVVPLIVWKMAAAAVIVGMLAGGWWLLSSRQHDDHPHAAHTTSKGSFRTPQAQPGVQLRLANGELIDLSTVKGSINAGPAQLSNTGDMLTCSNGSGPAQGNNSVIVPVGLDYRITLSDGTLVWLNSATRLDFPFAFSGASREITVDGEAYLQVAKDVKRPFIVHLPNSSVQVLGTTFNVNSYDREAVKIALMEGAVQVSAGEHMLRLQPGKQAVYGEGRDISQQDFDPALVLGWQKGLYYFNESTLADISEVLARWFGLTVVIDDPLLNDKKFVGVLDRNEPIDVFLDDLKVISGIDSYIDGKELHFK